MISSMFGKNYIYQENRHGSHNILRGRKPEFRHTHDTSSRKNNTSSFARVNSKEQGQYFSLKFPVMNFGNGVTSDLIQKRFDCEVDEANPQSPMSPVIQYKSLDKGGIKKRPMRSTSVLKISFPIIFFFAIGTTGYCLLRLSYYLEESFDEYDMFHLRSETSPRTHYTYTDPTSRDIVREKLYAANNDFRLNSGKNFRLPLTKHPKHVFYSSKGWKIPAESDNHVQNILISSKNVTRTPPKLNPHIYVYPGAVLDPLLRVTPGEETLEDDKLRKPYVEGDCVPMQPWQVDTKPSCNSLHEIDLVGWDGSGSIDEETNNLTLLGKGWFRLAWKVTNNGSNEDRMSSFVLKTLRYDRDFVDEFYDLHRKDAIAMERLTSSPHVLDVYSFCGQSALNEIANESLEKVARRLRDKNEPVNTMFKLKMAVDVSMGVADIHEIDGPDPNNATMVHYDLNPRNVEVMESGEVKINDFNVAEFMKWDRVQNKRCGFKGRLHEPWWRAPEEMRISDVDGETPVELLTEKVDIYSLGNILYRIMTGRAPRGKNIKEHFKQMTEEVSKGLPPKLPQFYFETMDPALLAIRQAMVRCYQKNPDDRWSARDVGNDLKKIYDFLQSFDNYEKIPFVQEKIKKKSPRGRKVPLKHFKHTGR